MRWLRSRLFNFLQGDDGPTAVEYAVMLALVVVMCISTIRQAGRHTRRDFRADSRTLPAASS
jgi:pilus assembly protein Flp/PilA